MFNVAYMSTHPPQYSKSRVPFRLGRDLRTSNGYKVQKLHTVSNKTFDLKKHTFVPDLVPEIIDVTHIFYNHP